MNRFICFFVAALIASTAFAFPRAPVGTWQCSSHDNQGRVWYRNNSVLQTAINEAWRVCKLKSRNPSTCAVAQVWCNFNNPVGQKWRCVAKDKSGRTSVRVAKGSRNHAYNRALQSCRKASSHPNTCRVITANCGLVN